MLAAGVLLVVAIAVFLALGRWKNPSNRRDLPKRLGIEIQQEANGFVHAEFHAGHELFKIEASRVVEMKQGTATLHDVEIDLYSSDGATVDRIVGGEFQYNQKDGIATAAGPVEITLMRPAVAPAIAPKAAPQQTMNGKSIAAPLAGMAGAAAAGQIVVNTSGLTFNQKTGIVTTSQHVDFSTLQASGSSMGATYDSDSGQLVLDSAVELTTQRSTRPVQLHAAHAVFERTGRTCDLVAATAGYRGGQAAAAQAVLHFREDGSIIRLDASGGFTAVTSTGSHLAAPSGWLDFDPQNQPRQGYLQGGVQMDSITPYRQVHGTSPTAELEFSPSGQLRHAHLQRGVLLRSQTTTQPAPGSKSLPVHLARTWQSPVVDLDFRNAGHGQVEPAMIHGTGGVVVTALSQRGNQPPAPSRLAADEVTGLFGPNSTLTEMTGTGNASIEETTPTGIRQSATGDHLEARFAPPPPKTPNHHVPANSSSGQPESAILQGHVVLVQQPPAKPNPPPPAPIRATAGRAVYESAGEWLHLTLSPRVEDGGLQLEADRIDLSRVSGDAFAHGDVKASWLDQNAQANHSHPGAPAAPTFGGQGPAHAIASEAVLHQATGEATFTGDARLWQQDNSVAGPLIILDRQAQTLVARTTNPSDPVRVVLLSSTQPSSPAQSASHAANSTAARPASAQPSAPTVIRVRGGDLKYSDAEHKAIMQGGVLGAVTAETSTATSISNQIELFLVPPASRTSGQSQSAGSEGKVDRMIASGHVTLTSGDRRGTGEQLVYTGATGEFVLTGTASAPPRMTDPLRGTVTGAALIFRTRDDSVSIEGGGHETMTTTTAPK